MVLHVILWSYVVRRTWSLAPPLSSVPHASATILNTWIVALTVAAQAMNASNGVEFGSHGVGSTPASVRIPAVRLV